MFCPNCGYQVGDGAQFCPSCGNPVAPYEVQDQAATQVFRPAEDLSAPAAAVTQVIPRDMPANDPYGMTQQQPVPLASAATGIYGTAPESPYAAAQNPAPYGAAPAASGSVPAAAVSPVPQKGKGGKVGIAIAIIVVAAAIAIALVVRHAQSESIDSPESLSGNSAAQTETINSPTEHSAPQADAAGYTLEDYLNDHPDEWAAVKEELADMETDEFSLDISVNGNEIRQLMTYKLELSDTELEIIQGMFADESMTSGIISELSPIVGQLEQETGIDGISWYVDFQSSDGTSIWRETITS